MDYNLYRLLHQCRVCVLKSIYYCKTAILSDVHVTISDVSIEYNIPTKYFRSVTFKTPRVGFINTAANLLLIHAEYQNLTTFIKL